ncbi:conserved hypothetical protein [Ammonifex degensii KC4]|uniref:phosphoserine phosphatase n=1 Tax=Ammonifex degensii (strain DSM 10501 / KC4) TaxID=429009 RepID=C9RCR1_AMMDK|nr:HAD hydrolase family protein [Ammonifex degensii]ACX52038.1 conserved hypothetical protein [Ammonifex degensii KC4]
MSILIAFDLEGPLSPQDNAYEIMGRLPQGYELFERLSRYDDLLTLEGRPGYEPGDTLALIVPFLLAYGVKEEDIRAVSRTAFLTPGAKETVAELAALGLPSCIISTSYCQHACRVAWELGLPEDWVACTRLPLNAWQGELTPEDREWILEVARSFLEVPLEDDEALKRLGESFFWEEMPRRAKLGKFFSLVRVVGGTRKTEALTNFARRAGVSLDRVVAVGDSITDFHMLKTVREAGGLSIVFNGNVYSLPYGTCAVASLDLTAILPLIKTFAQEGLAAVRQEIENFSRSSGEGGPFYHWLLDRSPGEEIVSLHVRFRARLRGRAAHLG